MRQSCTVAETRVRVGLIQALLALLVTGVHASTAQPSPLWGELEPGPYGVGFRVDFTYDYSRGYRPAIDYRGHRDSVETARPMQISIWYPIEECPDTPADSGDYMQVGDYIALQAGSLGPRFSTDDRRMQAVQALRHGPLSPFFTGEVPDDRLRNILRTRTAAIRNARPAGGPFPLVIHGGASLTGQSVLLEYLASHGYVVASVPLLGTHPAWFGRGEETAEAYQAGANDVGFVAGRVGRMPFADRSRTAMIGMFSAHGILYQMQNMQLGAIAVLDGRYPQELRGIPGFDPSAVRIPILELPRSDYRDDRSMLDSLRYANRFVVELTNASHLDFYQFQRLAHPGQASEHVVYRAVARITRAFLDQVFPEHGFSGDQERGATLAGTGEALGLPGDLVTVQLLPQDPPIPTAEEFIYLIRANRIAEARRTWLGSNCGNEPCDLAAEGRLTTTVLFLRRDVGADASLNAFELLVEMYPESGRARNLLESTREQADGDRR